MAMSQGVVKGLCLEYFPDWLATRKRTQILDSWTRGEQTKVTSGDWRGSPYVPEDANAELKQLAELAPNGFGDLIITSLAQTAFLDGVRLPGTEDNMASWDVWQENRWDAKQIGLHRAAIGHGLAYGLALPAKSRLSGTKTAKMQAISAMRMSAWYDEDDDEFPLHAILADPVKNDELGGYVGDWTVRVYDEEAVYFLSCKNNGKDIRDWTYISTEPHGLDVPPVVRYANRIDLDGRATGVIEPVIPLLRRLDQDTFDRIIVQRFGAWKVRWIAGMAKPTSEEAAAQEAIKLSMMDLLISTNENTKFGTLDATDMAGYISAGDADLRYLAAITQTPPHHLLGLSSNLQAEALAAAEKGLQSKSIDFKTVVGEAHEQMFRLVAQIMGNTKEATATGMKVRWRDTESRSLVQTANALTLLASGLGIPSEMLWERLPGWDDADSERALRLVESGNVDQLLAQIAGEQATAQAVEVAKARPSDNGGKGGSDNAPKK